MCPGIAVLGGGAGAGGSSGTGAGNGGGEVGATGAGGADGTSADGREAVAHPVDVITGRAYTDAITDFRLPGAIALMWERRYSSHAADRDVGLGFGWVHSFGWGIALGRHGLVVHTTAGDDASFPPLAVGQQAIGQRGWLLRRVAEHGFELEVERGLTLHFEQQYGLDRYHVLTSMQDHNGNSIVIQREQGRLIGMLDSVGRAVRFQTDAAGRIRSIAVCGSPPAGTYYTLVHYNYDEAGDLVEVIDAEGYRFRYAYDKNHHLVRDESRTGLVFHFVYDSRGRCTESWGDFAGQRDPSLADDVPALLADGITEAKGIHHCKLSFDDDHYTEVTDSKQVRRYRGNAAGSVTMMVDGGNVTTRGYDDNGYLVWQCDPCEALTQWTRDARGRMLTVTDPLGREVVIERDSHGLVTEVIDAAGGVTSTGRDARGNPLHVTSVDGVTTSYSYNERGQIVRMVTASGGTVCFEHDGHGNVTAVVLPTGASWRFTYNALGYRTSDTDPTGATTRFEVNRRGDLIAIHHADGTTTRYRYDGDARPIGVTDARGHSTTIRWGGLHRMCGRTDANGAAVTLRYDREGELVWLENERGGVHRFQYDASRRLCSEVDFAGGQWRYRRDAVGRIIHTEDPSAGITEREYDLAGQLTKVIHPAGGETTYVYDQLGLLLSAAVDGTEVSFVRDVAGRVVREELRSDDAHYWVTAHYDAAGEMVEQRSSLGYHEHITRDALGNRVETALSEGHSMQHRYDALGRELWRQLPRGGVITSTYHPRGRLQRRTVTSPHDSGKREDDHPSWVGDRSDGAVVDARYHYDSENNLIELFDNSAGHQRYEYDPMGQLVAVQCGTQAATRYGYDAAHNLLIEGEPRRYDVANRLLSRGEADLEWDLLGRLTAVRQPAGAGACKYHWDDNKLAAAELPDGSTVRYQYDAFGRRIRKSVFVTAATTGKQTLARVERFVWAGDRLIHSTSVNHLEGNGSTEVFTFVWDGHTQPLCQRKDTHARGETAVGAWQTLVLDTVLAPTWLIDDSGAVVQTLKHGPFGDWESDAKTPLRFAGQYADIETGLSYNRHRYYHPQLGRYISRDPLGLAAGLNGFRYCKNPTGYIDPFGWITESVTGGLTMTDDPSMYTLDAHGNTSGVLLPSGYTQDPKKIADYMRANGWNGTDPIRLGSCSTGGGSNSIAAQLAKETGVPVTAPTETLWVKRNGDSYVMEKKSWWQFWRSDKKGSWKTFQPNGISGPAAVVGDKTSSM